jgi:ABC-type proline/glycine betaine transport system ATPase subunit
LLTDPLLVASPSIPRPGKPSSLTAQQLRDPKTAAVIVTHDAAEARTLADRLLMLVIGRIAQ